MREIKFRGKRLEKNINIKEVWVYGDLVQSPMDEKCYINVDLYESETVTLATLEPVEYETVGQYIGVNDTNNVDIYEGDILNCWDDASLGIPVKVTINNIFDIWDLQPHVFLVIGNIHDE